MASSPKSHSRWQRRKEARPGEIVAAALALFVEKGFAATRLDEVARRAGVSKGTVYLYFESKEALFQAVVQDILLPELVRAEQMAADHDGSAADLLRKLLRDWWSTVNDSRLCGVPKLMVAEAGNFPELAQFFVDQIVRRSRGMFGRVVQMGIDRGEFRPCAVEDAVRGLMGPLVFASIWQSSLAPFDDEAFDAERYLEFHLENFLRGIAA